MTRRLTQHAAAGSAIWRSRSKSNRAARHGLAFLMLVITASMCVLQSMTQSPQQVADLMMRTPKPHAISIAVPAQPAAAALGQIEELESVLQAQNVQYEISVSAFVEAANLTGLAAPLALESTAGFPPLLKGRFPVQPSEVLVTQDIADQLNGRTTLTLDVPNIRLRIVGIAPTRYESQARIFTLADIPTSLPRTITYSWSQGLSARAVGAMLSVAPDGTDPFTTFGTLGCLTPFCGMDRSEIEAIQRVDRFSEPAVGLPLLATVVPFTFSLLLAMLVQRRYAPAVTTLLYLGISRRAIKRALILGAIRSNLLPMSSTIGGIPVGWLIFLLIEKGSLEPFGGYAPTWNYIAASIATLLLTPVVAAMALSGDVIRSSRRLVDRLIGRMMNIWDSKAVLAFCVALAIITFPRMQFGQAFTQELLICAAITSILGYGVVHRAAERLRERPGLTRIASALALKTKHTFAFLFAGIAVVTAFSSYNVSLFLTSQNQDRIEFVTSSPQGFIEVRPSSLGDSVGVAAAATGQSPYLIYEAAPETNDYLVILAGRQGRGRIIGIPSVSSARKVLKTQLSANQAKLLETGGALIGTNGSDGLVIGDSSTRSITKDDETTLKSAIQTVVIPMDGAWANGVQAVMLTSAMREAGLPLQLRFALFEATTANRTAIRAAFVDNKIPLSTLHTPPRWSALSAGEKFLLNLGASIAVVVLLVGAAAGGIANSARSYLASLVALGSSRFVIGRILFSQMLVVAIASTTVGVTAVLMLLAAASTIPGYGVFVLIPTQYLGFMLANSLLCGILATLIVLRKIRPLRAYDYIN